MILKFKRDMQVLVFVYQEQYAWVKWEERNQKPLGSRMEQAKISTESCTIFVLYG